MLVEFLIHLKERSMKVLSNQFDRVVSVIKKEMPNQGQRNNIRRMEENASGFIISSDGLLITNNHVAGDCEKITITLQDGSIYQS